MSTEDDVPVRYVMARFAELQNAFAHLDQKIEDRVGDFAVRIARLELRQEQTERALTAATDSRRWVVGAWIAGLSLLVALIAVAVALTKGGN